MPRFEFSVDCTACHGLCCVAPQIDPAHGFPFAKPPFEVCRHLRTAPFGCEIHHRLSAAGCHGCIDYTCHGAGPLITRHAEALGINWSERAADDPDRHLIFEQFLELHALFSALNELRELANTQPVYATEFDRFKHRLESMDIEQLLAGALDIGFEIRLVTWEAQT